jgi:hypothetical protein
MAPHPFPDAAPDVRLELRHGPARPVAFDLAGGECLIGSVAGCDLRVPGTGLPPVIAVVTRQADGVRLRKLAPAFPLLLNGQPSHAADLHDGDTIGAGPVSITVQIRPAGAAGPDPAAPPELDDPLDALAVGFVPVTGRSAPRSAPPPLVFPETRPSRPELSRGVQERERAAADAFAEAQRQLGEATRLRRDLDAKTQQLAAQQTELDRLRTDLTAMRTDLYQRYQERRDRLAGLQQAVQVAARKVQERKRETDEQHQQLLPRLRDLDARRQELEVREEELVRAGQEQDRARQAADEELRQREAKLLAEEQRLAERLAECVRREERAAAEERRYQTDLARLDRLQGTLEHREKQLESRATDLDRRTEQLQRDAAELEEQARQLDAIGEQQRQEGERLRHQRSVVEATTAQLAEKATAIEGQQAMLTTLRARLERMRDEVRREAQALTEQRARQEASERAVQEQLREAERVRSTIDTEQQTTAQERQYFEERNAALQAAVTQLRSMQARLTNEEAELRQRAERLDAREAEQAGQAGVLKGRAEQLLELQQRLDADRQALRDRETALAQAEEARAALQEQLRRRGEDLAARQKQLDEQTRAYEERTAKLSDEHAAVEQFRREADARVTAAAQSLEQQTAALHQRTAELADREAALKRHVERLKESGQTLAGERKAHFEAKVAWEEERRRAAAEADRLRAELEAFRRETTQQAADLQRQLPELELRGQAVLERLGQAREQLRGHLAELHTYARQSHDDLTALRAQVQAENERLRQQEVTLRQARAEHRLAVAGFRQQLIDWQARVAEMRQVLAQDGTRLERERAEVEAAAREVDATSQQLARQAAELHQQEQHVAERRGEVERHLGDMREWYRKKLRELAASGESGESLIGDDDAALIPLPGPESSAFTVVDSNTSLIPDPRSAVPESAPATLKLTDDLDPADRQLGELLRSAELIDADTLTALLLEARRQRRSLRQVLLGGRGSGPAPLSLYQLALIEAGNLDGLVLGPLRVIDRLHSSPREAVYRVFDPRRGQACLLRHLADAEAHDAVRPDEFRQRFAAAAAVRHPHVAATLEVLEVNGRPAALQEWLSGLPSSEWPFLAAAPGVWYRLVCQAALGLSTTHQAGLAHGHLSPRSVVLTADGMVKVTGFGEPPWLADYDPAGATAEADLAALGSLAAGWAQIAPRRKNAKPPRPLPEPLQAVLARLAADADDRYRTAAELLEDLDAAGADLPDAADAWERLLRYAGENATEGVAWRKSA